MRNLRNITHRLNLLSKYWLLHGNDMYILYKPDFEFLSDMNEWTEAHESVVQTAIAFSPVRITFVDDFSHVRRVSLYGRNSRKDWEFPEWTLGENPFKNWVREVFYGDVLHLSESALARINDGHNVIYNMTRFKKKDNEQGQNS